MFRRKRGTFRWISNQRNSALFCTLFCIAIAQLTYYASLFKIIMNTVRSKCTHSLGALSPICKCWSATRVLLLLQQKKKRCVVSCERTSGICKLKPEGPEPDAVLGGEKKDGCCVIDVHVVRKSSVVRPVKTASRSRGPPKKAELL